MIFTPRYKHTNAKVNTENKWVRPDAESWINIQSHEEFRGWGYESFSLSGDRTLTWSTATHIFSIGNFTFQLTGLSRFLLLSPFLSPSFYHWAGVSSRSWFMTFCFIEIRGSSFQSTLKTTARILRGLLEHLLPAMSSHRHLDWLEFSTGSITNPRCK